MKKLLKKVLYELYSLSRGYTPSLQFFEQDNMFTQRDTISIFYQHSFYLVLY